MSAAAAAATTTDTDMGGEATGRGGLKIVWEMLRRLFVSTMISYLKPVNISHRVFEADTVLRHLRYEAMQQHKHILMLDNPIVLRDAIEAVQTLNHDIHDYTSLKFETQDNEELLRRKTKVINQHFDQETYAIVKERAHQDSPKFTLDRQTYRTAYLILDTFLLRITEFRNAQKSGGIFTPAQNRSRRIITILIAKLFALNAFDSEQQTQTLVDNIVSKYQIERFDFDALETEVVAAQETWRGKLITPYIG
jgi:hypothetical protein